MLRGCLSRMYISGYSCAPMLNPELHFAWVPLCQDSVECCLCAHVSQLWRLLKSVEPCNRTCCLPIKMPASMSASCCEAPRLYATSTCACLT